MKISRITKLSGFVCIVLSITTLSFVFLMDFSIKKERRYVQRQLKFRQLGHGLGQASDFLTREARRYTIFGDKRHYNAYWKEVNETRTRDKIVERLKALGATPLELELIQTAKANSDALIATEDRAMKAVARGDLEYARTLMFDENYDRDKAIIMEPIDEFQRVISIRADNEAEQARHQASVFLWVTNAIIFLYVSLVLVILYFVFLRKMSRPLDSLTRAIDQVAAGKVGTAIPCLGMKNEMGQLANAAEAFKASLVKNQTFAIRLKKHRDELEQTVVARTKDLTAANNELEEFSYRTSHDLRSPLVSSIGLLSITEELIRSDDNDGALESLAYAQKSLQTLEILVTDILSLARAKGETEEESVIDLQALISDSLSKFSCMDHFERLEIQQDLRFLGTLSAKKSRATLIVENLISNALKYQDLAKDNPFIKITTYREGNTFRLEVCDNGLGVPKNQQENLFKMFRRFHPRTSFGSGLGLYMMKKSADILGGEISFEDLGDGSLFRLEIPLTE
ncbi:MAG: HAMP domain-containing histidine kinase [Kofleriaceae bacterium]|nr:HAMP domain-containing histidine kinase [Kofleriaceae bacterium]